MLSVVVHFAESGFPVTLFPVAQGVMLDLLPAGLLLNAERHILSCWTLVQAKVDCSNRQHRQGSESRHEHMQSKTQNKGSPPTTDSSQVKLIPRPKHIYVP